jgi:hypothetical protein
MLFPQQLLSQNTPNKAHRNDLGKRPNKESRKWVLVQRRMTQRKVLMDINIHDSPHRKRVKMLKN